MKISAAILASALAAAPAFAAEWAPKVNRKDLAAIVVTAPAAPAKAGPREGQNYSAAEEMLIKEFGITGITVDIPEAEVIRQGAYNNALCFEQAFRQALTSFLEDYKSPDSALANTLRTIGAVNTPSKGDLKKARQKMLELMNLPDSGIALISPYRLAQPQKGEKVEASWVFFLSLGDKAYWAIVDRSGNKAPYNYAAN